MITIKIISITLIGKYNNGVSNADYYLESNCGAINFALKTITNKIEKCNPARFNVKD